MKPTWNEGILSESMLIVVIQPWVGFHLERSRAGVPSRSIFGNDEVGISWPRLGRQGFEFFSRAPSFIFLCVSLCFTMLKFFIIL